MWISGEGGGKGGKICAVLLLGGMLVAGTARADPNHYINLLVGDRAAGMGGAYTAVSDDPSGLYYNPAGVAYADRASLSASMNTYQIRKTRYRGSALGGQGWERTSSSLVPNFFGVTQPVGRFVVGFSYAVPDAVKSDQDQVFEDLPSAVPGTRVLQHRINFYETDSTYNIGPSIARAFGDRFAVGLTLYGHYRQQEFMLDQLVELSDGRYEISSKLLDVDEYGLRPLVGMMLALTERLALGFSVTRVFVLKSDVRSQVTFKGYDYEERGEGVVEEVLTLSDRRKYPFIFRAGIAHFATQAFLWDLDVEYAMATRDERYGDRQATWNFALGMEYFFTPSWAVRAGVFTDRANTPDVKEGRTGQLEHVDLYGGALSVTHYARGAALTFGLSYTRGSGDAQIIGNSAEVQEAEISTLTFFISASYRN